MGNQVLMLAAFMDQPVHWWSDSNWWLVAIAAVTALFICWQSWETRRSAKATSQSVEQMKEQTTASKDAASAALLNAKALINAGRPWLLIDPKRSGEGKFTAFTFKAINRGRSPAEVINSGFEMMTPRLDEELPDEPYFGQGAAPNAQWVHTKWLAPGDDYVVDSYSVSYIVEGDPGLWTELNDGTRKLILMGFVRYRDTISNEVHESRYCYGIADAAPTGVYMTGPFGYNKLT